MKALLALSSLTTVLTSSVALADRAPVKEIGGVQFTFDSSGLSGEAMARLRAIARVLKSDPGLLVVLDGYTDPIGTEAYNVGLAVRRMQAVREALGADGVPDERFVLAAYGEAGERRPGYAANRRVTVGLSDHSVARVVAVTFRAGGTAVTWEQPRTVAQLEAPPTAVARR